MDQRAFNEPVRAIRGATTPLTSSREHVHVAMTDLLTEIVRANRLSSQSIVSAFFTVPPDFGAAFPVQAVRDTLGVDVPFLVAAHVPMPGSATNAMRVMMHVHAARDRSDISSIYMGEVIRLVRETANDLLLQAAIVKYGDRSDVGHLIEAVAIPWIEILKEVERDINFLYRFAQHPREFEEFIAGAYIRSGWKDVVLTPASGDLGRDIIVTATIPGVGAIHIVDQLKAYSAGHRVTADEVRSLVGVLARDRNVSKGIVTTTSEFAPHVYEEFRDFIPSRLDLKNGEDLRAWLLGLKTVDSSGLSL